MIMHQSNPAVPIWAFAQVVSSGGVGHSQLYHLSWGGAFAYPGATPRHSTHVVFKPCVYMMEAFTNHSNHSFVLEVLSVLIGDDPGDGAFSIFLRPCPEAFGQLICPHPG